MVERRTSLNPLHVTRAVVGAAVALTILAGCSKVDDADVVDSAAAATGTATTVPTAEGSVPESTASLTTVSTTTTPTETTPTTTPTSNLPVPEGYPISHPPGGDVADVTEEIESNSGTDQLVTRVEVWYDGDRFEEFAMFYLNWIIENEYLIADSLTNEDEKRVIIRGVMPPDNDTYGLTVMVVGDSTVVSTLWGRPPG
ncbi:MAG: hypothetical protein ACC654_05765 [Acidimicrobiia bacterium]